MNGIIIIDKPSGWTSHDVVGKLRGLLRERRIGHGGTLDPMATGVLPVFVGRATRAVEFCENAEKEYIAGLRLGLETDTQDITGTVTGQHEVNVSRNDVLSALARFTGEQEQIPPMYSAVKVGGQKLYSLARKGIEVERKPRKITISTLELLDTDGGDFMLRIVCSKGTYVRTLCNDIGAFLGCGGVMSSLRRTRAGAFTENSAVTLETVAELAEAEAAETLLSPVDSLFSGYSAITVGAAEEKKCRNGNAFAWPSAPDGLLRVYGEHGEFLLLGQAYGGMVKTVKSFFEV